MWFKKLTGFKEMSPKQVRSNLSVDGNIIKSNVNGKEYVSGTLETPSLEELRKRVRKHDITSGKRSVREVVANVQDLHVDIKNENAMFQVASQFNLLEMVSPGVTPEEGVGRYEHDHTQGPACAIACGVGTIFRNYFTEVNGELGQTVDNQIDCLSDLGKVLGNSDNRLWAMKNGYALPSKTGLIEISNKLKSANEAELDNIRKKLRIGVQWNTQVTISDSGHLVSQVYCSALPVAYSPHSVELWSEFAQLILDGAYEATFCAAILNLVNNGNNKLFLTLLGGGAFGNREEWIINAIERSLNLYKTFDLDVVIVSYGSSNCNVQKLIQEFS